MSPSLLLSLSQSTVVFEAQETSETDTLEGILWLRVGLRGVREASSPPSSKMVNVYRPPP